MIVGGYSLHLYCDCNLATHPFDAFPDEYVGETEGQTRREARNAGWILTRDRKAICPLCAPLYMKLSKKKKEQSCLPSQ